MNKILKLILIISLNLQAHSLLHLIHTCRVPKVNDNKLNLSRLKLTNINGIERIHNIDQVEELNLDDNEICCLKPLLKLPDNTKLKKIFLTTNQIKDLSPLQNFPGLTHLYIHGNKFEHSNFLSLVRILKNLEYVDIIEDEKRIIQEERKIALEQNRLECSICEEAEEDPEILTPCRHWFHKDCLLEWLASDLLNSNQQRCPNCRQDLKFFKI